MKLEPEEAHSSPQPKHDKEESFVPENQRSLEALICQETMEPIYQAEDGSSIPSPKAILSPHIDTNKTAQVHADHLSTPVDIELSPLIPKEALEELQEEALGLEELPMTIKGQQTELITNEVLTLLLDELMIDGFVLRELIKLQGEIPKGIKTNINSVKEYLAQLSQFIAGN